MINVLKYNDEKQFEKYEEEKNINNNQCLNQKSTENNSQERPKSALLRGVKITQFKDNKINPEPIIIDDYDYLIDDHLSSIKLKEITGQQDLSKVTSLEIKVNTEEVSLNNFGLYLPNLYSLKLIQSRIHILRDLGSSLKKLKILYMPRCELNDLDGLASFTSICQLYLPYNDISDISSCSLLDNLTILDLEGNNIDDISQLTFLSFCQKLTTLTLEGNPICISPYKSSSASDATYNYRQVAIESLGEQLKILDNEPIKKSERLQKGKISENLNSNAGANKNNEEEININKFSIQNLEEDWSMLNQLMQDGKSIDDDDDDKDGQCISGLPVSESRPLTSRPISSLSHIHKSGLALKASGFTSRAEVVHRTFRAENFPTNSGSGFKNEMKCGEMLLKNTFANPSSPSTATNDVPNTSCSDESGIYSSSGCESKESPSDKFFVCGNLTKALRSRRQKMEEKSKEPNAGKTGEDQLCGVSTFDKKPVEMMLETLTNMKALDDEINYMKNKIKKSVEMVNVRKAPQVLTISHNEEEDLSSTDDTDDEKISSSADSDNLLGGENIPDEIVDIKKGANNKKAKFKNEANNYDESIKELSLNMNCSIDDKRQSLMRAADFFTDLAGKPANYGILPNVNKTNETSDISDEDDDSSVGSCKRRIPHETSGNYGVNIAAKLPLPKTQSLVVGGFTSGKVDDEKAGNRRKNFVDEISNKLTSNYYFESHREITKPNISSLLSSFNNDHLNTKSANQINRLKPLQLAANSRQNSNLKKDSSKTLYSTSPSITLVDNSSNSARKDVVGRQKCVQFSSRNKQYNLS